MILVHIASHPRHKESGLVTVVVSISSLTVTLPIGADTIANQVIAFLVISFKLVEVSFVRNNDEGHDVSIALAEFVVYLHGDVLSV